MNVCFETFGCRLNRAEALENEAACLAGGHQVVTSHAEADLIVVRCCSVTARAQHDCEKLIDHLRRKYPNTRVFITGCHDKARPFKIAVSDAVPVRTARAYLKAQDGCSCRCSFCIVPRFRGASRSEPFDGVLAKASRFIEAGYREIVVTGCNLSLYSDAGRRLPELLDALAGLDPACRIRLGSIEPGAVAEEVPAVMAAHANFCRFLHIPVQSGSDLMLAAMKRPYRVAAIDRLIAGARKLMPDVAVGCDMISGFPGESRLDHFRSVTFLTRNTFVNVHAFPYSERPRTPAATLAGKIPPELRRDRARELAAVGEANRRIFAKSFLNREVEIVVEDEEKFAGWSSQYLWTRLETDEQLHDRRGKGMRRQIARILVRNVRGDRLYGEPV